MAITTAEQQFTHELSDVFDAEHRFLEGQHAMLDHAADADLKGMLEEHITQSEHHPRPSVADGCQSYGASRTMWHASD